MDAQLAFLAGLTAYENSTLDGNKEGLRSTMHAWDRNEKLWIKAGRPGTFQERMENTLSLLEMQGVVEVAIDGTIFPKEGNDFTAQFREMAGAACEELEFEINFDGFSYEEAMEITSDKPRFMQHLRNNELEFSYLEAVQDENICVLTIEQIQKLSVLSVQFDAYRYF